MEPLFGSYRPVVLPPALQWHVPEVKEVLGAPLLLAGRPVALPTHRVGKRTWPCLTAFPELGRECPHCDRSRRITCWVPLVTLRGGMKKVVVMGGSHTDASIQKCEVGRVVECHSARVIRPTTIFKTAACQLGITTFNQAAELLCADKGDITRWLLHYWQWAELTNWFGQQHRDSLRVRGLKERADYHGMATFGVPVPAPGDGPFKLGA